MKALVLSALLVAVLGIAVARGLAIYLGLDGGTPDWHIVAVLALATVTVYGVIRA